jgi:hypothetical protein
VSAKQDFTTSIVRLLAEGLGWSGAILVLYGILVIYTNQAYSPIDAIVDKMSLIITVSGVILTSMTIYLPQRPFSVPKPATKIIVVPLVIIGSIIALVASHWIILPIAMTNGFSALGLAGAILRLRPGVERA